MNEHRKLVVRTANPNYLAKKINCAKVKTLVWFGLLRKGKTFVWFSFWATVNSNQLRFFFVIGVWISHLAYIMHCSYQMS